MNILKHNAGALLAAMLAIATFGGCITAGDNAYKAIASTEATVDAAMKTWDDYVAWKACQAGYDESQWRRQQDDVKLAYTTYRTAMNATYDARASYIADKNAGGTKLSSALEAAKAAASTLGNLVRVYAIK